MRISSKQGFTLIELLVYIVMTSLLLITLTGLVMNIFNARRHIQASHLVQQNARFITNVLTAKIHDAVRLEDVQPAAEGVHFYLSDTERFSIELSDTDLLYREAIDSGSGFPEQSSVTPVRLNNQAVRVSSYSLRLFNDDQGNSNRGIWNSFILETGNSTIPSSYSRQQFRTFISLH